MSNNAHGCFNCRSGQFLNSAIFALRTAIIHFCRGFLEVMSLILLNHLWLKTNIKTTICEFMAVKNRECTSFSTYNHFSDFIHQDIWEEHLCHSGKRSPKRLECTCITQQRSGTQPFKKFKAYKRDVWFCAQKQSKHPKNVNAFSWLVSLTAEDLHLMFVRKNHYRFLASFHLKITTSMCWCLLCWWLL